MAKTIEQLAIQANEIQQATIQGENTALRVGGLFSDMVDYLATFHASDVVLGPLLTALNNVTGTPGEGMTLTFVGDGWDYSSAITQIRISQNGIEQLVASNYQAFVNANEQITNYINGVENQVLQNRADYDETQVEFYTWKGQTDRSISSVAAAVTVDGQIVSISTVIQTCDSIQTTVTNNWDAYVTEKNKLENTIFGYSEGGVHHNGIIDNLNAVTQESSGTASWIDQYSDHIEAVVVNFDNAGHPTSASGIVTTSTYSGLFTTYMNANGVITSGTISTYLTDFVTADGVNQIISVAYIQADKIKFDYTFDWVVTSGGSTKFKLDSGGNMDVAGNIVLGANTLRITSENGFQRYNTAQGKWIPMYAGRAVRYPELGGAGVSGSKITVQPDDDFLMIVARIGTSNISEVYIPGGFKKGKELTIRALNGAYFTVTAEGNSFVIGEDIVSSFELRGGQRAELIRAGAGGGDTGGYWYVNMMGW